MYIPPKFRITDKEKIFAFIKANAFGQLISLVEGKLFSSHIPFLLTNNNESLLCHLARQNPQWENIEGQEVLVTLQGPHDYVSPSWYQVPGVPTWNYLTAHIYGTPQLITESERIGHIVNKLSDFYESTLEQPWQPDYKDSMLKAIIGIEIKITDIQCKFKLSQNRSTDDRLSVIDEHNNRGSIQLSNATKDEL